VLRRVRPSPHADVLGPGTLRTLTDSERDRLALPQLVEGRAGAGGLMEEVLKAFGRGNETEPSVGNAFDRSVRRHW